MSLKQEILDLSRQNQQDPLSPWFEAELNAQIGAGLFSGPYELEEVRAHIVSTLEAYKAESGLSTAVLGMSGGVDSALTAALLRDAGWTVIAHLLPIDQDPEETERGIMACRELGIQYEHVDLSDEYEFMAHRIGLVDPSIHKTEDFKTRVRRGNLRARLRMMTLYDQAHRHGGLVASTDNFSELSAGFWTLHGDVGDLAPVQALLKSWEVPWLARAVGVPEQIWRAKPTDGLGIDDGDEAQLGVSYLEWDIMLNRILKTLGKHGELPQDGFAGLDERAQVAYSRVTSRLQASWHKRANPICLDHPNPP